MVGRPRSLSWTRCPREAKRLAIDGVYAGVTAEGLLKLYWGESKIHKNVASATVRHMLP